MPYPFSIAFRRDISCVMFSCTKIDVRLSLWKLLGGEYDPDTWPLEFTIDCFGDVSNPVDEFLVGKQQRNGPMHSDLMLGETASDLFLSVLLGKWLLQLFPLGRAPTSAPGDPSHTGIDLDMGKAPTVSQTTMHNKVRLNALGGAGLLCIWTSRIHGGFAITVMIEFRSHLYGQLQYAAKSWVFALELDPDWCWLPYRSLWAFSYLWSRLMNRELWLTGSGREMTMKLPRHWLEAPSNTNTNSNELGCSKVVAWSYLEHCSTFNT